MTNKGNLFPTVLEAVKSKVKAPVQSHPGESPLPLHSWSPLTGPQVVQGPRDSLEPPLQGTDPVHALHTS